jgi:hypothetical protein
VTRRRPAVYVLSAVVVAIQRGGGGGGGCRPTQPLSASAATAPVTARPDVPPAVFAVVGIALVVGAIISPALVHTATAAIAVQRCRFAASIYTGLLCQQSTTGPGRASPVRSAHAPWRRVTNPCRLNDMQNRSHAPRAPWDSQTHQSRTEVGHLSGTEPDVRVSSACTSSMQARKLGQQLLIQMVDLGNEVQSSGKR